MASEAAYLLADDADALHLSTARRGLWRARLALCVVALGATCYSARSLQLRLPASDAFAERSRGTAAVRSVVDACANELFQPDAIGGPSGVPLREECPAQDRAHWCGDAAMGPGTNFGQLCGSACDQGVDAWAMVCAWQAMAHLDEVCAGTFEAKFPDLSALPRATAAAGDLAEWPLARDGADNRLWSCDTLAVCSGCAAGGFASGCKRVAERYGGFGAPSFGPTDLEPSADAPAVGATAAVNEEAQRGRGRALPAGDPERRAPPDQVHVPREGAPAAFGRPGLRDSKLEALR